MMNRPARIIKSLSRKVGATASTNIVRLKADNVVMPDLDPAPVLDAVARDPRLRVFLGQGRIETIPARQSRRRLLLDVIAQGFEPGVRYSERRVSLFLAAVHDDYAALRRYLVDEDFLSRADGQYWRSGGTVLPSPTPGAEA
jgi:hypothetical protein